MPTELPQRLPQYPPRGREARARVEQAVPAEDARLRRLDWVGWMLMSREVWPEDSLRNAFFAYFLKRRRESLVGAVLPYLPFLLLTGGSVGFLVAFPEFPLVVLILLCELFLLPNAIGLYALFMVSREHRSVFSRINAEEILLTQLEAKDLVRSVGALPVARLNVALAVHLLAVFAAAMVMSDLKSNEYFLIALLAMLVGMVWFATRGMIDWAAANALRVSFLLEEGVPRGYHATKDYMIWLGLAYLAVCALAAVSVPLCFPLAPLLIIGFVVMVQNRTTKMGLVTVLLTENRRGDGRAEKEAYSMMRRVV